MNHRPPCTAWAEKLALRSEDLSPVELAELEAHIKTCPACEAAQADYHFIDARLRALPPPTMQPLPRLAPFTLRATGRKETGNGNRSALLSPPVNTKQPGVDKHPFIAALKETALYLLIAGLLLALLLAFGGRYINLAAATAGKAIVTYERHTDVVAGVAWSPDGRYLASASWDHTVQVWNVTTGKLAFNPLFFKELVNAVAWSPNGRYLAVATADWPVYVVDAKTGQQVFEYIGHILDTVVNAVAWSPDSRFIASGDRANIVQVWAATTGNLVATYTRHTGEVVALAWSPDGKEIASASWDHTVQVWQAMTGTPLFTYRGHSSNVASVAWSPNGRDIASGSWDNTVQVWQAPLNG